MPNRGESEAARVASADERRQRRREYLRLWRARNIERRREYRTRNAERFREWHRVWYKANRDRILASRLRTRRKNRKPRPLLTTKQKAQRRWERQRRRTAEHARKGLCPRCTRPLVRAKSRCHYHLREAAGWQRTYRQKQDAGDLAKPLTIDLESQRRRGTGTRQLLSGSASRRVSFSSASAPHTPTSAGESHADECQPL